GGTMRARYDQDDHVDLTNLPRPRRDMLPRRHYTTMNTLEATRGCIYKCEFCVVPAAWGRPIQKPVADVVDDVRRMDGRKVIFLHLTLLADVDYAKELFTALEPLRIR